MLSIKETAIVLYDIAFLDFYDKPFLLVMLVNVSFSILLLTSLLLLFHYLRVYISHYIMDNAFLRILL
jgi:hypothetical protein